ncbi:MAG: hypothetical protein C5S41_09230 [Candidatus Methanomarinus sp.]|jgi:ACT domain-containing protein|nr:MAG: hypothetical protein C5S41_09230 [ANME-2 cluster archaeon]
MIIDSLLPQFPVSINSACSCLNISRSQYYDWKIRNDSLNQSDPFEIQIKDKIHQVVIMSIRIPRIVSGILAELLLNNADRNFI